jgi:hypothetical protein
VWYGSLVRFSAQGEHRHLSELRCDGSSHGGCEADCLLFWKTAWVKPVEESSATDPQAGVEGGDPEAPTLTDRTPEIVAAAVHGHLTEAGELYDYWREIWLERP